MRRALVVGAGASGLAAARAFLQAGFEVEILEQAAQPGGLWVYDPEIEPDPLGQTGPRRHGSLYASLRTNLPRDLMAFREFPFEPTREDDRRFPHHSAVLAYLEAYSKHFGLDRHVRYGARVTQVTSLDDGWCVEWEASASAATTEAEVVLLCNGHFADPRIIDLPGLGDFAGSALHSHNYREPGVYAGARVGIIGASASAMDLALELGTLAKSVHVFADHAAATLNAPRYVGDLLPLPVRIERDVAVLPDDRRVALDVLIFCTGYRYTFPFLDEPLLTVCDNRVSPLYRQMVCIDAPTLACIGLPFMVLPFPLVEMQARWYAATRTGRVALPSRAGMHEAEERAWREASEAGVLPRHAHRLGFPDMFDYYDQLAAECGADPIPAHTMQVLQALGENRVRFPTDYRDRELRVRAAAD